MLSPGWPRVKATFLDWELAKDSLPDILLGLWLNIRVLAVSAVLIVVVGLGIAALRTLRGPLWFPVRALAAAYTDFFRGMPLIILLYLVGFGLPGLQLRGMPTSPVVLGTIALVLTYSAYVAEVFRAGIESVHPSQRAAARSLGLSYGQTMRRVVLPQAVRRVTPPLLNDFVALQKDVGPDLGARRLRRGPLRTGARRRGVQLHAVPGGRAALRAAGDPDHPGGRLGTACGPPGGSRRAGRCDAEPECTEPEPCRCCAARAWSSGSAPTRCCARSTSRWPSTRW